jgi:hypothetical protein
MRPQQVPTVAVVPEKVPVALADMVACVLDCTDAMVAGIGMNRPAICRPTSAEVNAAVADVTTADPLVDTRS